MSTEPNPLRWAVKTAEENTRWLAVNLPAGKPVSADFEGLLAKAHKACDRAELIEAEHQKLKEALAKLCSIHLDKDGWAWLEARKVLNSLSLP